MTASLQQAKNLPIRQVQPKSERDDTIELSRYLSFLFDYRWLIGGVALVVTLLGLVYALTGERVYEANILIQVEDSAAKSSAGAPKNLQTDLSTVFDIKTATASEMEILRSRAVVARAVDRTRLYIDVDPKYFPGIGAWISRHNKSLSEPGLLGMKGYVWGSEQAEVSLFNVPEELEGDVFVLTAQDNGGYRLTLEGEDINLSGRVGEILSARTEKGDLKLRVDKMRANPGAQFLLSRSNRLETIEEVQKRLKITENRKESGIIDVTLEGPDLKSTSAILNEIGREYVRQNVERKSEKAKKSLAFLDRQLPDLKQQLETSEDKYKEFRNRHRTFDLGGEAKAMLDRAVWVQTRMAELDQKKVQLLVRYENAHPVIEEIDRQNEVLRRQLASLDARIRELPELEQEVLRLNRDVKVNTDLYTSLLATAQQLRLVTSSEVGNARLLDVAEPPVKPIRPKRALVVVLSAFAGLLLGVAAAFCKKNLYGRVDDPQEIEDYLGLPVSATIPYSDSQEKLYGQAGGTKKLPVLRFDAPSDSVIESLRRLRTSVQFSMGDAANNIIMITGPTSGVGKSFVSVNFAAVLASVHKKVLLIDGDLRAGNLHRYFGLERRNGLADAIADLTVLDRVIRRNVVDNVDFISTGNLPDKPGELLSHGNLEHLLEVCSARYDLVLIDTAPVLAVSDALVVASHAGAILNIVRGGVSTVSEIEEAVKHLNQAGQTVTGIVFNDLKTRFSNYGYGSKYGKYRVIENA
jgi:tyrosine-protein kinase Etk/Wzc